MGLQAKKTDSNQQQRATKKQLFGNLSISEMLKEGGEKDEYVPPSPSSPYVYMPEAVNQSQVKSDVGARTKQKDPHVLIVSHSRQSLFKLFSRLMVMLNDQAHQEDSGGMESAIVFRTCGQVVPAPVCGMELGL